MDPTMADHPANATEGGGDLVNHESGHQSPTVNPPATTSTAYPAPTTASSTPEAVHGNQSTASSVPQYRPTDVLTMPVTVQQVADFTPREGLSPALVLADGSVYYGEVSAISGLPEGCGIILMKINSTASSGSIFASSGASSSSETYSAGDRYGGEWLSGQFHGNGVLLTATFTYCGGWCHGKMKGKCSVTYTKQYVDRMPGTADSDGGGLGSLLLRGLSALSPFDDSGADKPREYIGDIDPVHLRHGFGLMRYYNGDVYEGQWADNRRNGSGRLAKASGEVSTGSWRRDQRDGMTTVLYVDGSRFQGTMVRDVRSGEGVLNYANGDTYFGNFTDDRLEGHGVMRYKNGDTYEGQWKDGMRHGEGSYTLKRTSATVRGNFKKGLIQGPGTIELPGVSTFVGEFHRGERLSGSMFWHPGAPEGLRERLCYQGDWDGEAMHGHGLLWFRNGDFYFGSFVKNEQTGLGNYRHADGTEYSGSFLNGERHGRGLAQAPGGTIAAGWWRHNTFVEGYRGEWDGHAVCGVGHLRLSLHAFLTGIPQEEASAAFASAEAGSGGGAAALTDRGVFIDYFGIFSDGLRDGAGVLKLPVVDGVLGCDRELSCANEDVDNDTAEEDGAAAPRSGKSSKAEKRSKGPQADEQATPRRQHIVKASWTRDVLHCPRGVWALPTGEVYIGGFEDGVRAGPCGRLWLPDGAVFEGEWRHNSPHGVGRFFEKNTLEPIYQPVAAVVTEAAASSQGGETADEDDAREKRGGLFNVLRLFRPRRDAKAKATRRAANRRLIGYRDYRVVYGRWQGCCMAMVRYLRQVDPLLAVQAPVPDIQPPSTLAAAVHPRRAAQPSQASAAVSDAAAGDPSAVPLAASTRSSTFPLPKPADVVVGCLSDVAEVRCRTGLAVRGEWRSNYPLLATPFRPASTYDCYLQRLQAVGALPETFRRPSQCSTFTARLQAVARARANESRGASAARDAGDGSSAAAATTTGAGVVQLRESGVVTAHPTVLLASRSAANAESSSTDDLVTGSAAKEQEMQAEDAAVAMCTFCEKPYGFFRRGYHCFLCMRSSCAACLGTLEVGARAELAALVFDAHSLAQRLEQREAAAVKDDDLLPPDAASALMAQGISSVSVCSDCVRGTLVNLTEDVMCIPMRLFASVLPRDSSSIASTPMTARRPQPAGAHSASEAPLEQPPEHSDGGNHEVSNGTVLPGGDNGGSPVTAAPQLPAEADEAGNTTPESSLGTAAQRPPTPPLTSNAVERAEGTQEDEEEAGSASRVIYAGYTSCGIPHLYGELWWGNKLYYAGDFFYGERHGYGTQLMFNGERYVGHLRHNRWHGEGTYFVDDGAVYQGRFRRGVLRQLRYHGEVDARLRQHGRGISYEPDGGVFNGEWVHGVRHGTGQFRYANGDVYSGQLVDGHLSGKAKIETKKGVYYGDVLDGCKHGAGVEFFAECAVQGQWKSNALHGRCRVYNRELQEVYVTTYRDGNERDDCFQAPLVVSDQQCYQCAQCGTEFTFFLRRHHCRLCGNVFCGACTRHRALLPHHFNLDGQQRVCDKCFQRLEQRRMLGVKYYPNGAVYAGCWSHGAWVSRGLYCRPDGIFIVMDDSGSAIVPSAPADHDKSSDAAPKVKAATQQQCEESSADAATTCDDRKPSSRTSSLRDATPSREVLDALDASSTKDTLDAFTLWWATTVSRCALDVPLDVPLLQRYHQLPGHLLRGPDSRVHRGTAAAAALAHPAASSGSDDAVSGSGFACPPAPEVPQPKLFVSFADVCRGMKRASDTAPSHAAKDHENDAAAEEMRECDEAAALRAARFMPAVIPVPPQCQPSPVSAAPPLMEQHDISDEEILEKIKAERLERFGQVAARVEAETGAEEEEARRQQVPVATGAAAAAAGPPLTSECYVPLLPRTPAPPECGTNRKVYWDEWTVKAIPPLRPPVSTSRGAAASSEVALYFTNPFWRPIVPDVQAVVETGKLTTAAALMQQLQSDAVSTAEGDASVNATGSSAGESSSSSDDDKGYWHPQRSAAGADGSATPGKTQNKKRKDASEASVSPTERGWLPVPMAGPFRFTVQQEDGVWAVRQDRVEER